MRRAIILGLTFVVVSGRVAAGQAIQGQVSARPRHPHEVDAFHVTEATPLAVANPNSGIGGLNLASVEAWNTENVTVYAKHHIMRPPTQDQGAVRIGPVAVSGSSKTDQIGFSGVTATAALPILGVPGLDAVANLTGGHDALNSSTTRESAALTAGLRLKF